MSLTKRMLDDLNRDEELERIYGRPEDEEWPSRTECQEDAESQQ